MCSGRIELPTFSFGNWRSILLSYEHAFNNSHYIIELSRIKSKVLLNFNFVKDSTVSYEHAFNIFVAFWATKNFFRMLNKYSFAKTLFFFYHHCHYYRRNQWNCSYNKCVFPVIICACRFQHCAVVNKPSNKSTNKNLRSCYKDISI